MDAGTATATLVGQLASQGLLGVVCALALYIAYKKDKDVAAERDARIVDAKSYTDMALKLQAQVLDSVNKLSDVLGEMRKLMAPPGGNR